MHLQEVKPVYNAKKVPQVLVNKLRKADQSWTAEISSEMFCCSSPLGVVASGVTYTPVLLRAQVIGGHKPDCLQIPILCKIQLGAPNLTLQSAETFCNATGCCDTP
ncbi:hypothetical protein TNCV_2128601 [Trichonephila clavipes]|nr:hypothetical protein TNCV_2128601 [Trichonephila clavipes]